MMAYVVLARKYRPRDFREVRGQDHTVRALVNALDFDRLHHAYLFSGTRGVGKTTLARIFANCLNCEEKISSTPCGDCIACEGFQSGNYPDMYEVDAASRTGVDDMRKLLENVHYSPNVGRFKVYLIDEVHMLSTASFNALLKTLEEPPNHVKFIFATTDPKKVPLTVLSRCLQFHLRNIEPTVIKKQLETILTHEDIQFDEASLQLLARSAQGSMRDALSLTDQAVSHGGGSIAIDSVAEMLGTVRTDEVLEILNMLVKGDRCATLAFVNQLSRQAVSFADLLENLQRTIHELALAQITGQADTEQLQPFVGKFSAEWLQVAYQILVVGMRDLKYAPDHKIGFEMTLVRLLDFEPATSNSAEPSSLKNKHTTAVVDSRDSKKEKTELGSNDSKQASKPENVDSETIQTNLKPVQSTRTPNLGDDTQQKSQVSVDNNVDREIALKNPIVSSLIENFDAHIVDIKRS
ncbi:MAG: DNA polymerase III subunit gamma/tau [Gammaproteobacteria bacterium]|nr:DNA polymerase III subunit gamma/tau [Gammaproteobacteria bacterium]MYF03272.1 DNA polymerase III subunit gamma/tau [Gammaproteobacteria bacterium]MYI78072.1 DNA polymerase III subunit gamma/tau [Gammaproteobacteria bacterium]